MNYINNLHNMCCAGFGDNDTIRVERKTVLVDAVSNEVCELVDVKPGHSYDCEERWALIKSYTVVAHYPTESAARAAYKELVDELASRNHVIPVPEG